MHKNIFLVDDLLLKVPFRISWIFVSMAQPPLAGQNLLIIEVSRSHSYSPHSVRLLWTSDLSVAETSP